MKFNLSGLKSSFLEHAIQIPGWHTGQKLLVIESDDWGMIRMASKEAFYDFLTKGYQVNKCVYSSNDSLENNEDLECLYDVLDSVRDRDNRPAKFTINNIVANPNFTAIRSSGMQNYVWERFTDTLKKHPDSNRVMDLYYEGIEKGFIQPQFHGREHLGIGRWMQALKNQSEKHLLAFDHEMYAVHEKGSLSCNNEYLNAFVDEGSEYEPISNRIAEGLDIFESIWGFRSQSLIAPCYTWNSEIESDLFNAGIRYIQGARVQIIPFLNTEKRGKRYRYCGEQNHLGQRYLIRNVHFEPVESPVRDHVNEAMAQIDLAFRYRKPAIIGSHRVNYIGSINPENRENGCKQLRTLLHKVVVKWPDVRFISSDELGLLMDSK